MFDQLLAVALLLQQDLARSFEGTALTPSRTHLLWELHRLGPSTQRALAAALSVTPRNVTGLVDALETAGHLERRPHPSDRRATLVTLIDLGAATMAVMAAGREAVAAELMAGIEPARLAALRHDLGHHRRPAAGDGRGSPTRDRAMTNTVTAKQRRTW